MNYFSLFLALRKYNNDISIKEKKCVSVSLSDFFLPGLTLGADPRLEVLVVPEEVELQSGLRGQLLLARRVRTLKSKNQALKGTLVRHTIHRDFDL